MLEHADVREALAAAFAFWRALAADDDAAVTALLDLEASEYRGPRDHQGPLDGIAASTRDHLGLARATCAVLGVLFPVALIESDGIRPFFAPTGPGGYLVHAGQALEGWTLELWHRESLWLVDPTPRKVARVIGRFHEDGRIVLGEADEGAGPSLVH